MIHHEIDQLQTAKDEMLDLRDSVVRLEQQQRRRKARSIDQVSQTRTLLVVPRSPCWHVAPSVGPHYTTPRRTHSWNDAPAVSTLQ